MRSIIGDFHFPPDSLGSWWPPGRRSTTCSLILAFYIGRRIYGTTIARRRLADLGSYRLVSADRAGGGMGEVWRAATHSDARPVPRRSS
jgi:hypothetical protein